MSAEHEQHRLSRRSALAGAAWSAPVIVVATAAPAFATSNGSGFDMRRGASAAILTADGLSSYWDLEFTGLSVLVPTALGAGQLTLTVTFSPTNAGGPSGMQVLSVPDGWTSSPGDGGTGTTVLFTYGPAVPAQTEIQVQPGIHVGAQLPAAAQTGTYVVTAAAPGQTPDTEAFPTGAARPARSVRPVARPRVD
jgi:hypothetical protein